MILSGLKKGALIVSIFRLEITVARDLLRMGFCDPHYHNEVEQVMSVPAAQPAHLAVAEARADRNRCSAGQRRVSILTLTMSTRARLGLNRKGGASILARSKAHTREPTKELPANMLYEM